MTAVTARLIPVISLYYPAFAARFGSDDEGLKFAAKEYADRLQFHSIDGKMFMAGIRALKARGAEPFHPNPEQFALMCKQAAIEALNIPQFQVVLSDVIKGKQALRFGEAYVFIHPLSRIICSRKGDLIYELTGIEFEKAIKSEYEHWVKRLQDGEQLPEPVLVLGHDQRPEMPVALRVVPKSAMAMRVEAMRADALAEEMTLTTNVNIAARSAEERATIELDKQRWIEANSITDTKSPDEIRAWLLSPLDEEYCEDMRRRLNVIRRTRLEIKNNVAGSSHKRRAG